MSQQLTESTSESIDAPPTPRDLQKNALRDLLFLSRECSRLEAEIEAEHQKQSQESKIKFEHRLRDFDYRLDSVKKQIDEKIAEKASVIVSQYKAGITKVASEHAVKREKILSEFSNIQSELKKRFDHASWLADSVLEAAELKAQQEHRKDNERHADLMEEINKREAAIVALVQTYGVEPIPANEASIKAEEIVETAEEVLAEKRQAIDDLHEKLKRMSFARLFVGLWPVLIVLLFVVGGVAYVQGSKQTLQPQWNDMPYPVGGAFVGAIIFCAVIKLVSVSKVKKTYTPLRFALADTRIASTVVNENAERNKKLAIKTAQDHRNSEVERAKLQIAPVQQKAVINRDTQSKANDEEKSSAQKKLDQVRVHAEKESQTWKQKQVEEASAKTNSEKDRLRQEHQSSTASAEQAYQDKRAALQNRWKQGLENIRAPIGEHQSVNSVKTDWITLAKNWQPPKTFPPTISFGAITIDMARLSEGIPKDGGFDLEMPDQFAVPALLAFPSQASVLIQTDPDGREEGLRALQMIMTKLLISLPPARARFTIIDPVGLGQSFAGFMHLADHDDQLVNGRIWTTTEQIEQRVSDLTEHMETVIQKYLRNEFETIDDYNAQAGELAEPYRFLVIADFPNGFQGETWRKLISIARTGSRCGVYVLMLRDIRASLPQEMMIEDIESVSANIVRENGRWIWKDETFSQFPLTLDVPPEEEILTKIVHKVGEAAKEANRVEVDFDAIAPREQQYWTMSAADEIAVPVGRMGATRLQYFRCGRGVAQHTLVAGKTGSGKSTLLHAMVTNLAMWYSPDEVEFYLIDFKKGVEFKVYADYLLPHARAIAVESDREFGLSVLQRIDAELSRRGELFRKTGVQDLGSYREVPDAQVLPRVMLIIDEFQEFFTEDDKLAQEAQLLMDRLVRQGRAFGIHVFLGSQTIGGSGSLARSTIGQMAIRIALQCNETDSQLILGDNNSAARLLSRPGEAIYNDAGGAVENNSPFQVAWLPDAKREKYLARVQSKLKNEGTKRQVIPPIVFEGNAPADISKNYRIANALVAKEPPRVPTAWLGDPVAIKDPTSILFRRQSGANALIIGQQDEQAMSTLLAITISIASQYKPDQVSFVLVDGTPADSSLYGEMQKALEYLPHTVKNVDYRRVDEEINSLAEEQARRQADDANHPAMFVIINGLQRYRTLRKGDDDFSFSMSDEPKKANPAKQLVELLREGPNVGIHVVVWCDTLASIERTFDRGVMREFDHRILFQMSANDSSNLIDSPVANRLGFFRALAYSEEQGVMEKFRPYGLPPTTWLQEISQQMKK